MAEIHRLVARHGRERARELVPATDRALVDIAAEVLAADDQLLGITYSGFCLTAFPHKRLADDAIWERRGHHVSLLVEPGRLRLGAGPPVLFGVPYGARARIILIYLQIQAIRTGSREVQLGRSMRDWMSRMDVAVGGETARALRDQARRISACLIKFFWSAADDEHHRGDGFERGAIVRSGFFLQDEDNRQSSLFDDVVVLDETFFRALQDHPVPLLESAVRQIKEKSMALDLYVWLAYRLHSLADRHRSIGLRCTTRLRMGLVSPARSSRSSSMDWRPRRQPTLMPRWTWVRRPSRCIPHGRQVPWLLGAGRRHTRDSARSPGAQPTNAAAPVRPRPVSRAEGS